jgi:hypothetical protein
MENVKARVGADGRETVADRQIADGRSYIIYEERGGGKQLSEKNAILIEQEYEAGSRWDTIRKTERRRRSLWLRRRERGQLLRINGCTQRTAAKRITKNILTRGQVRDTEISTRIAANKL